MSALHEAVESYLALRRGLGTKLRDPGAYLHRFVEFLKHEGVVIITTQLALRWATSVTSATSATWARRLGDVRRFAVWMSTLDSRTEVPPHGLLPDRYRRRKPYIYSDDEVERVIDEAAKLSSSLGLRADTYATLFGLLAATGLRLGEALALERDDVDFRAGLLSIRHAKFGKSRFVPVHDSTCAALHRYAQRRDVVLPRPASPAFLLSERGTRITHSMAEYNFDVVSTAIGIRPPTRPGPCVGRQSRGPRLHDLRHRLAARTLVRWYREGRDVERELPKLSTYLGHVHVADTYWYIEAVPELLQLATDRATGPRKDPL